MPQGNVPYSVAVVVFYESCSMLPRSTNRSFLVLRAQATAKEIDGENDDVRGPGGVSRP
jgi:hypothetical protein